jgi:outer membrane OprD family porin
MNYTCVAARFLGLIPALLLSLPVAGQSRTAQAERDDPSAVPASATRSQTPYDASGGDNPEPTSTEQGQTSIDSSFEPRSRRATVREERRKALQDTDFYGELRSFYMNSDNLTGSKNEAWALGGSVGLKTGYFRDLFAVGATAYTSQRLAGPDDKDGTTLLSPGQQGYSVLGEAYTEILITEGIHATVGLKGYDTPFVSRFDTRMTPNTFEAAAVQGSAGGGEGPPPWRFGAAYFDKIKQRDSEDFISMATAAGARAGVSRGVSTAGATYKLDDASFGAIVYHSSDIINIAYLEAKDAYSLTDRLRIRLAAQYTEQRSAGENLLMAHPFSAHQFGSKAELAFQGALLTVAYTGTGNGGTAVQSPWSANPGYTTVQVGSFDRSGENAWMARAAYNFPMIKNLSAYALYVHGSSPNVQRQYAQQEYDFNLQWKAMSGKLRGLTLLARFGHVSEAGPDELHTNQWRLATYYDPPWL